MRTFRSAFIHLGALGSVRSVPQTFNRVARTRVPKSCSVRDLGGYDAREPDANRFVYVGRALLQLRRADVDHSGCSVAAHPAAGERSVEGLELPDRGPKKPTRGKIPVRRYACLARLTEHTRRSRSRRVKNLAQVYAGRSCSSARSQKGDSSTEARCQQGVVRRMMPGTPNCAEGSD